ncbi:MAG: hypothetical protein V4495_15890 [Pseudomonadota bacterium]
MNAIKYQRYWPQDFRLNRPADPAKHIITAIDHIQFDENISQ